MTVNIKPIRADFAAGLRQELDRRLGAPGSEVRARLEAAYGSLITEGKLDLDKLPDKAKADLLKLQKASEDFEGFFVKKLLAQMRSTSFSQKSSPMMDFAKEGMDDAIAGQAAKGHGSIGIARTVFLAQGLRVVQDSAEPLTKSETKSTNS